LRKKPRTSPSEDWFASHGKFIAVAFVLALIATVYFARVNRERTSVAKQDTSSPPAVETPAVAAASPLPPKPTNDAPVVQTASAAAPSPVELRAPQFVAQPSADKTKDNLFEFAAAKNANERIAARPDDAAKNTAPALTAPALAAPSLSATPEVVATPAPQPAQTQSAAEIAAYPVTTSPSTQYPVSIPPAAAYPTTSPPSAAPVLAPPSGNSYQPQPQLAPPAAPPVDYRSQYPVTPAPTLPQQPAWQGSNVGQPASYQPYDTTARGLRNERTGSGTY